MADTRCQNIVGILPHQLKVITRSTTNLEEYSKYLVTTGQGKVDIGTRRKETLHFIRVGDMTTACFFFHFHGGEIAPHIRPLSPAPDALAIYNLFVSMVGQGVCTKTICWKNLLEAVSQPPLLGK